MPEHLLRSEARRVLRERAQENTQKRGKRNGGGGAGGRKQGNGKEGGRKITGGERSGETNHLSSN